MSDAVTASGHRLGYLVSDNYALLRAIRTLEKIVNQYKQERVELAIPLYKRLAEKLRELQHYDFVKQHERLPQLVSSLERELLKFSEYLHEKTREHKEQQQLLEDDNQTASQVAAAALLDADKLLEHKNYAHDMVAGMRHALQPEHGHELPHHLRNHEHSPFHSEMLEQQREQEHEAQKQANEARLAAAEEEFATLYAESLHLQNLREEINRHYADVLQELHMHHMQLEAADVSMEEQVAALEIAKEQREFIDGSAQVEHNLAALEQYTLAPHPYPKLNPRKKPEPTAHIGLPTPFEMEPFPSPHPLLGGQLYEND